MGTAVTTGMREEASLFDYPIHLVDVPGGLARVEKALDEGRNLHVVTLNPEMLMQGEADPELSAILKQAGLVIPDGAGTVWALRRKGIQVKRLPGIEFSEAVLDWAAKHHKPIAIIGAKQEVLETAIERLKARFSGLNVVYARNGFFNSEAEQQEAAQAAAALSPSVVLVAMGVPRQEKWIARYGSLFQGAVLIGVGGSLDVWSGQTKRAPALMRALNLEWLYRITSEPWRIRRIAKTLPMFVVKVWMEPLQKR